MRGRARKKPTTRRPRPAPRPAPKVGRGEWYDRSTGKIVKPQKLPSFMMKAKIKKPVGGLRKGGTVKRYKKGGAAKKHRRG